ncbi:sugar porter family MFS transporter [Vibrio campbellii]|uniref:Arabinose-proton symporter n=1 Tax=Vibrio fortis TaxID=212667 RepID=A0A066UKL2_9VIBR|nr:sugar porter family MFS transporter [Vibrio fortis]KDN26427.1 arabinose-proton symporter [Vibrio fortis]
MILSENNKKMFFLTFICAAATIGGFLFGMDTIVIGGTITQITQQFELSALQQGWYVSSALVGCLFGSVIAGPIADYAGRKKPLMLGALLAIISVLGCMYANSFNLLIWARIIGGFGIGIATVVCPMYIAEVAPARHRGKLSNLFQVAIVIGLTCSVITNTLIVNYSQSAVVTGHYLDHFFITENWRGMFSVEFLPAVIFLGLVAFFPESPRWLISKAKEKEAASILRKFLTKGEAEEAIIECRQVIRSEKTGSYKQLVKNPVMRFGLMTGILLAIWSEWSGVTVVMYYGPVMLEEIMGNQGSALGGFGWICLVSVIFTSLSMVFIDKVGRRKMLITSALGCFTCLIGLAIFFDRPDTPPMLIVGLMAFFVAFTALGLGPLKFTISAEILPTSVRGRAVSITTAAIWIQGVILNSFTPAFRESFGTSALFIMFAIILLGQVWFAIKILPETANRSLESIEKELKQRFDIKEVEEKELQPKQV